MPYHTLRPRPEFHVEPPWVSMRAGEKLSQTVISIATSFASVRILTDGGSVSRWSRHA